MASSETRSMETVPAQNVLLTGQVMLYRQPELLSRELHGDLGMNASPTRFAFAGQAHICPLTVPEFEEWGNPKKKAEFDYMITYSPYDNIEAKAYPDMLVRTSFNDSQVMYWEPAKYVAKMRATRTDHNTLILKTNMNPAGHGGASGRYDRLHETAFDYAYFLTEMGIQQ